MYFQINKIITVLILAGTAVLNSGCASTAAIPLAQNVHTYDGEKMALNEVAVLKQSTMNNGFTVTFASIMRGIASTTRKFDKTRQADGRHPSEIYLKPDKYIVMVKCTGSDSYAFPAIPITVTAGMTYEIECSTVPDSGGRIRGKISYVSSTDSGSR